MLRVVFFAGASSLVLASPCAWATQSLPPPPPPPPGYHGHVEGTGHEALPPKPPSPPPAPKERPAPRPPKTPPARTPPKTPPARTPPKTTPPRHPRISWTEPPDGTVTLRLHSDQPEVRYQLFAPGGPAPVASCTGSCTVYVKPGRYRLHASRTSSTREGSIVVHVQSDSRVLVSPRGYASRWIGLGTAVAGMGMVVGGLAAAVAGNDTVTRIGAATFLAGAAMTPVGWVIFGRSYRPSVRLLPEREDDEARARLGIGPGGLSFSARF